MLNPTCLLVCWVWFAAQEIECGALLLPDMGWTPELHPQLLDIKLCESKEGNEYNLIREETVKLVSPHLESFLDQSLEFLSREWGREN